MKKFLMFLLSAVMAVSIFGALGGCGGAVKLTVVSPFHTGDGNRTNFVNAYKAYEEASGNTIVDKSAESNEYWKKGVTADFKNNKEPDILFYFTGAGAKEFINDKKVVAISEIRKKYKYYAGNMKDELMPVAPDGRQYAVPVNGFWEGLFVNKKVLADCGLELPGADYTWEQFLADCQIIKDKGYAPVACSLKEVPHYWFEFCTLNNGTLANHLDLPKTVGDAASLKWAKGLEDIKTLYYAGFFPDNTLTAGDAETCRLMLEDKAAFLIDGSWKVGYFQTVQDIADNTSDPKFADTIKGLKLEGMDFSKYSINNYAVAYIPAKGERKAAEIISGFSMGYYITKKAWDNPKKQKACVEFIMTMTTDDVVSAFGTLSSTALKEEKKETPADASELIKSALAMYNGNTGSKGAVQDLVEDDPRAEFFASFASVVSNTMTPADAIKKVY